MSKLLKFLGIQRFSEDEILMKFVNQRDSVLVIGPLVGKISYKNNLKYWYDITLIILIKRIRNDNITVIDIQGGDIIKDVWGRSDLFTTKESIQQLAPKVRYVISDALKTPFPNEYFDVIIDRETSKFIAGIGASKVSQILYIDENKLEKLIYEYNRILKEGGKIIFFSSSHAKEINKELIRLLRLWGYRIKLGKLKHVEKFIVDNEDIIPIHKMSFYIVATKK